MASFEFLTYYGSVEETELSYAGEAKSFLLGYGV